LIYSREIFERRRRCQVSSTYEFYESFGLVVGVVFVLLLLRLAKNLKYSK